MPTPETPTRTKRTLYLNVCAKHGIECYSVGAFRSREEAVADMILTAGHPDMGPACGSPLNTVEM